jgi:hypothetical protein|tara:strand:- start:37 stop:411 length:375 start_codon:yes stop_codon:yes gene_type:complete
MLLGFYPIKQLFKLSAKGDYKAMRITKAKLREIIKEEIAAVSEELEGQTELPLVARDEMREYDEYLASRGLDPNSIPYDDYVAATKYSGKKIYQALGKQGAMGADFASVRSMGDKFFDEYIANL